MKIIFTDPEKMRAAEQALRNPSDTELRCLLALSEHGDTQIAGAARDRIRAAMLRRGLIVFRPGHTFTGVPLESVAQGERCSHGSVGCTVPQPHVGLPCNSEKADDAALRYASERRAVPTAS